jgi:peptidoglycan hydrolase CwlO-like protein
MAKTSAPPNKEILEAALQGLEAQRQKLEEQIQQVRTMIGSRRAGRPSKDREESATGPSAASGSVGRKKRVLSSEARKRIAAAQKKRWAAFRKKQG